MMENGNYRIFQTAPRLIFGLLGFCVAACIADLLCIGCVVVRVSCGFGLRRAIARVIPLRRL